MKDTGRLSPEIIDAAHNGDVEGIAKLVAAGYQLEGTCEDGSDLLYHFVWQCSDAEKLRKLLDLGCKPSNRHAEGGTPLVAAVWTKNPEIVKLLLDAGADPNVVAFIGDDEASALDTVIDDYCDCDSEDETQRMILIEGMIRAAGGRVHRMLPNGGHYPDWRYQD